LIRSISAARVELFTAAGGSGDQHQSLARIRKLPECRRQVQRFDGRYFFGKHTDTAGHRAALMMDIRAKTSDALAAETQVDGLGALELAAMLLREEGKKEVARLFCAQRRPGGRKRSCDPQR
jgi:hypothetical protein